MNTLMPVGELFRKSWSIYKERFRTLFILVLIGWILSLLTAAAIAPSALGILMALRESVDPAARVGVIGLSGLWAVIVIIAAVLVGIWLQVAMMFGVSEEGAGKKPADLLRRSGSIVLPFLAVSILTALAVLGGFILLIIPGIIFALWFWMSTYVVLFEGKRGTAAMRQSRHYVKGVIWPMIGRLLFIGLIAILVSLVVGIIERPLGLQHTEVVEVGGVKQERTEPGILNSAVFSLLGPLFIAYSYLLYKDIKKTKDNVPATTEPAAQA